MCWGWLHNCLHVNKDDFYVDHTCRVEVIPFANCYLWIGPVDTFSNINSAEINTFRLA